MKKTSFIVLLILSLNLNGFVHAQSPLWNPNYNKVQKLVFDNSASGEDLVNFTVLVHLDNSTIDWDDFQTDGDDIRFIDEDYETWLSYEVETWNHGYNAWIWVKVPQIDSNSAIDHIYMYYDNPLAVNGEDKEGTWNDDYVMVQHMVDETNASILDSTQYDNDGTKKGVNEPIETTDGQIDSAQDFDGVNDYVSVNNDPSLNPVAAIAISAWVYCDSVDIAILLKKSQYDIYVENNNHVRFRVYVDGAYRLNALSTTDMTGAWHFMTGTYDNVSRTLRTYIDGIEESSSTLGGLATYDIGTGVAHPLVIGRDYDIGLWMNGTIDSVRIFNTTRSADWIKAQYLSMTENYITYKELSLCESRANIFPLVLIALFVIIGIVVVSRA